MVSGIDRYSTISVKHKIIVIWGAGRPDISHDGSFVWNNSNSGKNWVFTSSTVPRKESTQKMFWINGAGYVGGLNTINYGAASQRPALYLKDKHPVYLSFVHFNKG